MAAYGDTLSEEDRWALAFYVGAKAVEDDVAQEGEQVFTTVPGMKSALTLDTLVAQAPEDVLKEQGPKAYAALGYLRRSPGALFNKNRFIALSHDKLSDADSAYQAGDKGAAKSGSIVCLFGRFRND